MLKEKLNEILQEQAIVIPLKLYCCYDIILMHCRDCSWRNVACCSAAVGQVLFSVCWDKVVQLLWDMPMSFPPQNHELRPLI